MPWALPCLVSSSLAFPFLVSSSRAHTHRAAPELDEERTHRSALAALIQDAGPGPALRGVLGVEGLAEDPVRKREEEEPVLNPGPPF